jgi:hypothetical protein
MSHVDTGGFDLVLGVSPEYVLTLAKNKLPSSVEKTLAYDADTFGVVPVNAHIHLTCHADLAFTAATVVPGPSWDVGPTVSVGVKVTTSWTWDDVILLGDVIVPAGQWPRPGDPGARTPLVVVTASGALLMDGADLKLGGLTLTVTVPPGGLEQLPAVAGFLAAIRCIPVIGDSFAQAASDFLYNGVSGGLNSALAALIPPQVKVATLPASVTVRFGVAPSQPTDLLAMIALTTGDWTGEPPGLYPAMRSPIRHAADGHAKDLLGVVINNYWLLRHGIRPTLTAGFGLTESGFALRHPCYWFGSRHLTDAMGISVDLTSVLAQIDMTGALTLTGSVSGKDPTGGFGISGTFTVGVRLSPGDGCLTLGIESPSVSLDLSIAWWVYVAAAMTGGSIAVTITALSDAFAGGTISGAVSAALASKMKFSLPLPIPAATQIQPEIISTTQPDADWQFAQLPFLSTAIPVTRCNDVVLGLGTP